MNNSAAIFSLYFNTFGKSPGALFKNLEPIDINGFFLREKTPEIGSFLHLHFILG